MRPATNQSRLQNTDKDELLSHDNRRRPNHGAQCRLVGDLLLSPLNNAAACDATVDEVNQCLEESQQALEDANATFNCEESTVATLAADPSGAIPESCVELRGRCAFLVP